MVYFQNRKYMNHKIWDVPQLGSQRMSNSFQQQLCENARVKIAFNRMVDHCRRCQNAGGSSLLNLQFYRGLY